MSATRNEDAVAAVTNQGGQFHSKIERDEPLTTHGHKPGVKASPADNAPEFHAQTLPPGTAPADRTFRPNANNEVPPVVDYSSNVDPEHERSTATDTLGGASSADVHTGLGHPGQGQTSTEIRHDGQHSRAKQGTGLVGTGASGMETGGVVNASKAVNPHDPAFANQRGLEKEEAGVAGERGNIGGPSAEERIPESSETVAAEAPKDRSKIH
ncbi:hypothetical protein NA57DRAFT_70553 [Rhizodiscina lignyota]|uniref:Uncharacterized protein n=1 Tax=Rhizodiscina lignyota TaxID=1504668 RepID=A0A9P4IQQ8_9PEZI|nr:hypothetical protein NA57DRAFT_70553 [Rhizodiscina lignyota]